jgi:hypothetical protein
MYSIQRGIKIPPRRVVISKYAFLETLEIGDSVLLNTSKEAMYLCAYARNSPKFDGKSFIRRKVEDGYRVWRVK